MKAVVMTAPGGPEVLKAVDLPKPTAGPNEILVRVMAVGVNPIDYKLRTDGAAGPKNARVTLPPNFLLGFDVAGVVEQTGPGASRFKPGDRVFYTPDFMHGAYAEYNVVSESLVARMPENLSFEQAAAIPVVGTTAWDSLFTRGNLVLGETVLIAGANGGVGSLAVQLAKAGGAFVIATCSPRSSDFVKTIPTTARTPGPDVVVHYTDPTWPDTLKKQFPAGIDLVFDCVGQDVVSKTLPLIRPNGRIVTIVNPAGTFDEAYRRNVAIHYYAIQRSTATMDKLRLLLERNQITPLIETTFLLEKAADAHRKLEAGGIKGKIVLTIA